ncbi:hypothetical protein GOB87_12355 [Acetobacter estunensis]|uniref:ABC-type transport auxiliary lipoprotein component domain-containing protein n=1 Tax=Acetobacter estunensis TaxID=104097 RepID=A0A967EDW5_9PROT|nr:PqiC family protein [Acetobacter estunensis]NHO54726.1 hypothetical protein [Acetobacter estunensis]
MAHFLPTSSAVRVRRTVLGTLLLSVTGVTLVACSSSTPSLYSLQPSAARAGGATGYGLTSTTVPTLVEVRKPTIPETLDRDRIVLDDSGYKLDVATTDAWSAPLSAQIPHVVVADLRQRLPGTTFFVQDDATASDPQAFVELVVTRFSREGAGGPAVLDMQVVVHRADSDTARIAQSLHLTAPAAAGTEALVGALSTLLGQASDQIAAALRSLPPEPSSSTP